MLQAVDTRWCYTSWEPALTLGAAQCSLPGCNLISPSYTAFNPQSITSSLRRRSRFCCSMPGTHFPGKLCKVQTPTHTCGSRNSAAASPFQWHQLHWAEIQCCTERAQPWPALPQVPSLTDLCQDKSQQEGDQNPRKIHRKREELLGSWSCIAAAPTCNTSRSLGAGSHTQHLQDRKFWNLAPHKIILSA